MKAVASRDEVTHEFVPLFALDESDARRLGLEIEHADVGDLEVQRQIGGQPRNRIAALRTEELL